MNTWFFELFIAHFFWHVPLQTQQEKQLFD